MTTIDGLVAATISCVVIAALCWGLKSIPTICTAIMARICLCTILYWRFSRGTCWTAPGIHANSIVSKRRKKTLGLEQKLQKNLKTQRTPKIGGTAFLLHSGIYHDYRWQ